MTPGSAAATGPGYVPSILVRADGQVNPPAVSAPAAGVPALVVLTLQSITGAKGAMLVSVRSADW